MTPKNILLVDDDPDDQFLFTHALQEVNASVNCFCISNAEQAIETLEGSKTNRPDYVFLDLNLPLMDGLSCLQYIKNKQNLQNIPVVIYSTSSRQQDKDKAKELGAVGYIQKPSTFSELVDMIQKVLPALASLPLLL